MEVKYLGLHLDQKLTWKTHIKAKRWQLELKLKSMYWLMNKKSKLSVENELTIHKAILKPVWTYGTELWGFSKPSKTRILQTYQSKTLRMISSARCFVSNLTLHNDLKMPFVWRNHTPCQQIQNMHHWEQQPTNKWTVSPIKQCKKTPKNMARRPS
jgi:hypothetical protein